MSDNNVFRTKSDYAVALQPWTVSFLAANVENIARLVSAWVGLTTGGLEVQDGQGTVLTAVNPQHITDALPALRASCSNPADFDRLEGLGELVRFTARVWEFNEIGVGLGEAHRLHERILSDLVGAQTEEASG